MLIDLLHKPYKLTQNWILADGTISYFSGSCYEMLKGLYQIICHGTKDSPKSATV